MFIKLLIRNNRNCLIGTIYSHYTSINAAFQVKRYVRPVLNKTKTESKAAIMAGDVNLNYIKYTQVRGVY